MRTTDKPFKITKKQVYEAYKAVKSNHGAAGVDKETIEQFEADLSGKGLVTDLFARWQPDRVRLALRITTATFGTTAPDGSETMPRIVPDVFCAHIGARNNVAIQKPRMKHLPEGFMGSHLHAADRVSKSCCLALSALVEKHAPIVPRSLG